MLSELQKQNRIVNIFGIALICLIFVWCYQSTLIWMYDRYMGADSYYSHGFLIPFVSIFLVFQQKSLLSETDQETNLWGLAVIVFALLLHVLGTILYVFSLSGFSIFFLIVGLSLFLFGKKISRIIWFPLVFLVFMFPLPEAVIGAFSFPLKIFATKSGVWVVRALGIPIYSEGFNIHIPAGHLLVGNPCSGLRSLIAFLALGSILAHLEAVSTVKKWLLFFMSIPIALFSNIVRIPILILVSNYWGLEAATPDTFVHTGSGLLVFVLGFLLLIISARGLQWRT